jgi:hypothetical protein
MKTRIATVPNQSTLMPLPIGGHGDLFPAMITE